MEYLQIRGRRPLTGTCAVGGAKNAALPLMAAALMIPGETVLRNVPDLSDVEVMASLLRSFGVSVKRQGDAVVIDASAPSGGEVPSSLTGMLRASTLLLAPALDRFGEVALAPAGGCRIGERPVDLHLRGMSALGASFDEGGGVIRGKRQRRRAAAICLDYPSVGATENIVMAAVRARGRTVLKNAAAEPEIDDLCRFLNGRGAKIAREGNTVVIDGVTSLSGGEYTVLPDRVVGGTALLAAAAVGGDVTVTNVGTDQLAAVASKLAETSAEVTAAEHSLRVRRSGALCGADLRTMPYPGFPTDLQPPFTAAMTVAEGTSVIREEVFENRLGFCDELVKFGAGIRRGGGPAVVRGVESLRGADVRAEDLRGGAALTVAALAAEGESRVFGLRYIDRGYEAIETMFAALGGDIVRRSTEEGA